MNETEKQDQPDKPVRFNFPPGTTAKEIAEALRQQFGQQPEEQQTNGEKS